MAPPATARDPIRLLLVDDHIVVRQGLRMLLDNHADLKVIGEASTAAEALDWARRELPAVVLLDLLLGETPCFDLIPVLSAISSETRVLVLTGVRDPEQHRRAIRAGASGVVLKDQAGELLVKAVRRVHAGDVWVDRGTAAAMVREVQGSSRQPKDPDAERIASLTAREREIVRLVSQGYGTQKMADLLSISEKTVRNHLVSIYDKLQVSERVELALYAVRHGLAGAQTSNRLD